MARSLELFLGTRAICLEFAKEPLDEVAVDIIDHDNKTYVLFHDYNTMFCAAQSLNTSRNDLEAEGRELP